MAKAENKTKKRVPKETRSAVALRARRFVAELGDIGTLPAVADPQRKVDCGQDLIRYARTYYPHLCFRPFSPDAVHMLTSLQRAILGHGRFCVSLPRGSGKTTLILIAIMWAILYGHRRFVVVAAATQENADLLIADVVREFEENERLAADFPEVCVPFRALEGRYQRAQTQSCNGIRTKIRCKTDRLGMPEIAGSAAAGAVLLARGLDGSIRGLKVGKQRPDFLAIDDPQTRESAKSARLTAERETIIKGDLLGLAGHDRQISAVMSVTVIEPDDLSARFLDRDRYPDWMGHVGQLVYAWPTAAAMWAEYEKLWRSDNQAGDGQFKNATAYYAANRAVMDAGAQVADPELYDRGFEISALQHAYDLLYSTGDSFWAEYQNSPKRRGFQLYDLAPSMVAGRVNRLRRWEVDRAVRAAVAFTDINDEGMRWAVAGWAQDGTGFVLDYGKHPERGDLVRRNSTIPERKRAVAVGLHELKNRLARMTLTREGKPFSLKAFGVDRGFLPEAVHQTIRQLSAPFPVLACKGYGSTQYNPSAKSMVGKPGHFCHMTESKYGQYLAGNVDYFKEVSQRGFLVPPGVPGSISLFAAPAGSHEGFGDHICAEKLTDKGEGGRVTFWKWNEIPNANNGWFDALVGCLVLGTWFLGLTPIPPMTVGEDGKAILVERPKVVAPVRRVVPPARRRSRIEIED